MRIYLESDEAIVLEGTPGPLTIESETAEQAYSPFHMLASALATCTFSVLHSWAEQANLQVHDLRVRVEWSFAETPRRVGQIRTRVDWPELPPERHAAAARVAELCAVHKTLSQPPEIALEIRA